VVSLDLFPATLWPPNHRMVDIAATVIATDVCSTPGVVLTSVTSDEPDNDVGIGDGNTDNDIQEADTGTPDFALELRAERAGTGDGRTYTVVYTTTDAAGNQSSATGLVDVPHNQNGKTDPIEVRVEETTAGTLVTWSPAVGASSYNVIRGKVDQIGVVHLILPGGQIEGVINLGPVVCLETASMDESTAGAEDALQPMSGAAFFYLVEYTDEYGPRSYGTESATMPRMPESGDCP
jgi:hypothetical protein